MVRPLYTSEPMDVQGTLWRIVIFQKPGESRPLTYYEWQDAQGTWREQEEWPAYDAADPYFGLPVPSGLNRLYGREHAMVRVYCRLH